MLFLSPTQSSGVYNLRCVWANSFSQPLNALLIRCCRAQCGLGQRAFAAVLYLLSPAEQLIAVQVLTAQRIDWPACKEYVESLYDPGKRRPEDELVAIGMPL